MHLMSCLHIQLEIEIPFVSFTDLNGAENWETNVILDNFQECYNLVFQIKE